MPDGSNVEIKVHMVSVPMHVPMPMTNNEDNPNNKEENKGQGGIPGFFFRGMRKKPEENKKKEVVNNPKSKFDSINNKSPNMNNNKGISVSGKSLMSLIETITLEPPKDHTLRLLWDRILDDDMGRRIIKSNSRILIAELKRTGIEYEPNTVECLEDILRKEILSKEQVRKALLSALKLEAGRYNVHSKLNKLGVVVEDGGGSDAVKIKRKGIKKEKLRLSLWSLDTALSSFLKNTTPRFGKLVARSKDEISAMVTDKHERALITNVITPQDIGVTYDMIGGLDEVKETLRQCITYPLKYPRLYQEGVASEAAKGVLLFGPPGTGKTMLAKAVATEGGATFLTVDASTIENKWLGESEKNARAVFTLARRLAPCVIYLDEVDSVLSSRENGDDSSHGTLTSVKTTLMQEWDGLRTTKDRVVVIASTNRPFDLDEAVLRRLPRRIMVDLPDTQTRSEILAVTLSGNRLASDVNLTQIANTLEGYTGSDIKEVCREAVLRVSHERAVLLEQGGNNTNNSIVNEIEKEDKNSDINEEDNGDEDSKELHFNLFSPLRPVNNDDFKIAMQKLKASVHDSGRELQKVIEWNEKYGEVKRKKKIKQSGISMYI